MTVCTFLRCRRRAVVRLEQSIGGGTPWFGCELHAPAMQAALSVGMPGASSGGAWVEVTHLPTRAGRR